MSDEELQYYNEEISRLESRISYLNDSNRSKQHKINQLELDLNSAEDERDKYKRELHDSENRVQDLYHEIASLRCALDDANRRNYYE